MMMILKFADHIVLAISIQLWHFVVKRTKGYIHACTWCVPVKFHLPKQPWTKLASTTINWLSHYSVRWSGFRGGKTQCSYFCHLCPHSGTIGLLLQRNLSLCSLPQFTDLSAHLLGEFDQNPSSYQCFSLLVLACSVQCREWTGSWRLCLDDLVRASGGLKLDRRGMSRA